MENTIIYLIGHYGVGKLTVAKELVSRTNAKLFDNHLINDVIFNLIDASGAEELPPRVWDYTAEVRDVALRAILDLAPRHFSYVLTNALKDLEEDRAIFQQIQELGKKRGGVFVPVVLTCSEEVLIERVRSEDRRKKNKLTDAEIAMQVVRDEPLLPIEHENLLSIDTSRMSAAETAQEVLNWTKAKAA